MLTTEDPVPVETGTPEIVSESLKVPIGETTAPVTVSVPWVFKRLPLRAFDLAQIVLQLSVGDELMFGWMEEVISI